MTDKRRALCGADLERWRLTNGLTKASAADAFGLQVAKWDKLTDPKAAHLQLADPALALLLQLYISKPESSPVAEAVDMNEFYAFLGFDDKPRDRELFASMIGRSAPSAYRLLLHGGKPGRQLTRLVVALQRLGMTSKATRALMAKVTREVGEMQGCPDVLENGWKSGNDEE
ncbi:hypothetical protein ACZ75_06750 [Massilia sp. NR 4-1]|nr:hypothetical protein ACZ75_06750 [Massilia sp. NR 4-1]